MGLVKTIVGEEIMVDYWPFNSLFDLFLLDGLHIFIYSWENKTHFLCLGTSLKDCGDIFEIGKINFCKLECKIHSCCYHDMIRLIVRSILLKTVNSVLWIALNLIIRSFELRLNKLFLGIAGPLSQSTRSIIELMHYMGEDTIISLISSIDSFEFRFPCKLHLFIILSLFLIRIIDPCKTYGLETHFRKEFGSGCWMSERIWVPSVLSCNIEIFEKELMSSKDIHDQLLISRAGFICWNPATINEFETALLNKGTNIVFSGIILSCPPSFKEIHFSLGEFPSGFSDQCSYNICNYVIHPLSEVIFSGYCPTYIIVRVTHNMEKGKFAFWDFVWGNRDCRFCLIQCIIGQGSIYQASVGLFLA